MKILSLSLFLASLASLPESVSASCDLQCVHGYCAEGDTTCTCDLFFTGKTCDISWKSDVTWYSAFEVFAGYTVLLFSFVAYRLGRQLWVTIRHGGKGKKWHRWTLVTYLLSFNMFACLLRILEYSIDPHTVRGINSVIGDEVLFELPIVFWIASALLLQLYWVELQMQSGIVALYTVKKFKPLFIGLIGVTVLVIFPVSMWRAFTASYLASVVYTCFLVLVLLANILLSFVLGPRLYRFMRSYGLRGNLAMNDFLKRTTDYVIGVNIGYLSFIILMLLYTIVYARNNRWLYTGLHCLLRTTEAVMMDLYVSFVSKKRPSSGNSGQGDSSRGHT